jgi:adenine-specific DNA-methyltransferase
MSKYSSSEVYSEGDSGLKHHLYCSDNLDLLKSDEIPDSSVDLVYIDPPYNTGNTLKTGFKYNDAFIKSPSHSVWLNFMAERLILIKEKLKEAGILAVSIDDSEMPYLKVLLDSIMGETNFIANIVVDGGTLKNNARFISTTHEYLLVYAKNLNKLKQTKISWRSKREGVEDIETQISMLKSKHDFNYIKINEEYKSWLKLSNLSKRLKAFKYVDENGVYTHSDLSSPGSKHSYDFKHPLTGKNVKKPSRGWGLTFEKLSELAQSGEVEFFKNETYQPLRKLYLKNEYDQVIPSIWSYPARSSTHLLQQILGERDSFNNPKNLDFISKIIETMSPKDGVVLDVFAGSGTTGHAVLDLNSTTGSSRKFILCTSNENNIFLDVLKPRIIAAASGEWASVKRHDPYDCVIVEYMKPSQQSR